MGHGNEQLDRIERKLDSLHTMIMGAEGQGGLHRWVHDIDADVKAIREQLATMKGKILGVALGISSLISLVGVLATLFLK